jgi:hypothetical protein
MRPIRTSYEIATADESVTYPSAETSTAFGAFPKRLSRGIAATALYDQSPVGGFPIRVSRGFPTTV